MVNPQSSSAEKVDKVDADDVRLTNSHLFKYILPVSSCGDKTLSFPPVLRLFLFAKHTHLKGRKRLSATTDALLCCNNIYTFDRDVVFTKGVQHLQQRQKAFVNYKDYIGRDITSLVTLPVWIMEPYTMLQKVAEIMEYTELLDRAAVTEDPYERCAHLIYLLFNTASMRTYALKNTLITFLL